MATKTTTVYVCDRCGAEYTDKENIISLQVYGYSKINIGKDDYGGSHFDLCRDCEQSFIGWADALKGTTNSTADAIKSVNAFIRNQTKANETRY